MVKEFGTFLEAFAAEYFKLKGYVVVTNVPFHKKKPDEQRRPSDLDVLAVRRDQNIFASCTEWIEKEAKFDGQVETLKSAYNYFKGTPMIPDFKDLIDYNKNTKFVIITESIHEQVYQKVSSKKSETIEDEVIPVEIWFFVDKLREFIDTLRIYMKKHRSWQPFGPYSWLLRTVDVYGRIIDEKFARQEYMGYYFGKYRYSKDENWCWSSYTLKQTTKKKKV